MTDRQLKQTAERHYLAELHRLAGACRLAAAGRAAARAATPHFERAIAVARAQEARLWELRATTSLAQIDDRACPALAALIDRFDRCVSAELVAARAVLAEGKNRQRRATSRRIAPRRRR